MKNTYQMVLYGLVEGELVETLSLIKISRECLTDRVCPAQNGLSATPE